MVLAPQFKEEIQNFWMIKGQRSKSIGLEANVAIIVLNTKKAVPRMVVREYCLLRIY